MSLDRPRILVIDDDCRVLNFMERVLSNFGFEVDLAAGGQQGIACYSEGMFDLVLVDLKMQ